MNLYIASSVLQCVYSQLSSLCLWALDNAQSTALQLQDLSHDAPVLILLPGLTGGSHDSYVRHMVGAASKNGMRAVVFNSRGTSDGAVTSPQFYSASYTEDMRYAGLCVTSGQSFQHPLLKNLS